MAATANVGVADAAGRALLIERIFDASREFIFKCWSEPEHFVQLLGPKGFTSTILVWELREGGKYRIHKRGPDGQDHWQQGVFREIVAPERIVRTYCWKDADGRPTRPETLLTVTFTDLGERTKLTLHQALFESDGARDDHQRGWSSTLDQLAEYISTV
jgi:uncharacterized protein YndB with AHSA1/START domain